MVITDYENDAGSREATGRFQVALSRPKQTLAVEQCSRHTPPPVDDEIHSARLRIATIIAARRVVQ